MPRRLTALATGLLTLTLLLLSCATARAQAREQLTLMTWNIHGGNSLMTLYPSTNINNNCVVIPANVNPVKRRIALYNSTHTHKIDAIALQEVHKGQAEELARGLGYPPPYFVTTKVCNSGNRQLDYGNAVLSPHRMTSLYPYQINNIADSERKFGEYNRIAAASVWLPSGRPVRVYSSHLTANPTDSEAAHQALLNKQVSEALFIVIADEYAVFHGLTSVLMTDFNTTERTDAYDHMVNPARGGLFDDAWRKVHPAGTGRTYPASTTHLRLDHIFYDRRSKLTVTGAEVLDICDTSGGPASKMDDCISDHRPVVATMLF
jgi:endonuclease/exonuclease/phosphatase family metal-dependent hydrolase